MREERGNRKTRFCLVGSRIHNSLSPKIFNYWFKKHNIRAEYLLKEVQPTLFKEKFLKIINCFDGCNVTSPYKQECKNFLSNTSLISINTVWRKKGFNTDYTGFKKALRALHLKQKFYESSKILILGYGGVSKMLFEADEHIKEKADLLVRKRNESLPMAKYDLERLPKKKYDFVINCSTTKALLRNETRGEVYLDLNYSLREKDFFARLMLLYQAAESFYLWIGFRPAITKQLRKSLGI